MFERTPIMACIALYVLYVAVCLLGMAYMLVHILFTSELLSHYIFTYSHISERQLVTVTPSGLQKVLLA